MRRALLLLLNLVVFGKKPSSSLLSTLARALPVMYDLGFRGTRSLGSESFSALETTYIGVADLLLPGG